MGGWGSNRWGAYQRKARIEESLALETTAFCRVPVGSMLNVSWGKENHIKAKRTENGVFLGYKSAKTDEVVGEALEIVFNSKSNRWYWVCPDCCRSVTKLHKPFDKLLFRCRHCHNLTYKSVQERRKYQSLARYLAKGTDLTPKQMERFLHSDWGR